MGEIITTGNRGKTIRSDCSISLELTDRGGIDLHIESKVKVLYGNQMKELALEIMSFYKIENAILFIEDSGALPLVMAARLEAAIRKLINTDVEFLLPFLPQNDYQTSFDKSRISRLYLPGNSPSLMINAGLHHPDGIILDLEDSVAPDKKYEARFIVRNALRNLDFYGAERMVRINQSQNGLDDLNFIVPHHVNLILIPKCESATQIHQINERIEDLKTKHNISSPIWLMPIIESALGVIKAFEIATSAPNIVALAIGLEDYTADIGTKRTAEGTESLFARSQVVNASRAAGIQAIDSVFSDVSDMEALKYNVIQSKSLGFEGMGCIHPRQIKVVHDFFAPDPEEIEKAKEIVTAFHEASERGLGVVALGTKMIDAPVVKRARKTLETAIKSGKLKPNWEEEENVS
ncbi:MAG: aldolase/citrate lyase family protein [Bacteroidales bacterium]